VTLHHARFVIVAFFFIGVTTALVHGDDWPSWRGPEGNGHSRESGLPRQWDAKSVVWTTALPGEGQSSPVVWGDRIFLTTALEKGRQRVVLCIDRKKGDILWQQVAWTGTPEKSHQMNGWASATCATDGERVIAFFGKGGMHCYSVAGEKLWSRNLGAFAGQWGTSACPLIVGDLVIQNCDSTAGAFIVAVNKKTGEEVWKTPRVDCPRGGWSSPVLVDAGTHKEIVLNGETMVTGYDPGSGKVLWHCKSFNGRGEPTVAPGKGLVYVVNGLAGDVYAVKLGGSGDVTKSHIAWHTPRKGDRDQPSPILAGTYLLVADMGGICTCYDNTTGKIVWRERLHEGRYTASPIVAAGLVYFLSESGVTTVIEPGPTFKVVAENALPAKREMFRASLAPSQGQIFARSQTHLYCIGK
jgi:outer membrane protein assembly factor BamB